MLVIIASCEAETIKPKSKGDLLVNKYRDGDLYHLKHDNYNMCDDVQGSFYNTVIAKNIFDRPLDRGRAACAIIERMKSSHNYEFTSYY